MYGRRIITTTTTSTKEPSLNETVNETVKEESTEKIDGEQSPAKEIDELSPIEKIDSVTFNFYEFIVTELFTKKLNGQKVLLNKKQMRKLLKILAPGKAVSIIADETDSGCLGFGKNNTANVNLLVDGGDFYISHNEDFNFVESLGISMSKIDIRE
jgi:hypothetical protein